MITLEETASLVALRALKPVDVPPIGNLILSHADFEEFADFTATDARLEDQYEILQRWLNKRRQRNGLPNATDALTHVVTYLTKLFRIQTLTSTDLLQRLAPLIWNHWDHANDHAKFLYALWSEWDDLDTASQWKELTSALSLAEERTEK